MGAFSFPAELASGAIFGSALLASGVSSPSVIVSQMRLENFHMLKSFLAASGCSAVVVRLADHHKYVPCRTRTPSNYGWFPYDANILGGFMIGAGMALTGACPGTVLAQIATGLRSGVCVGLGGLVGGVLYTGFAQKLRHFPPSSSSSSSSSKGEKNGAYPAKRDLGKQDHVSEQQQQQQGDTVTTVQSMLKTSTSTVLLTYEALLLGITILTQLLAPQAPHWLDPIVGGVAIGAAQAATVLLAQRTVGVSTAFQDLGRRFWRAVSRGRTYPAAVLATPATVFAIGILAGAAVLAHSGIIPASALARQQLQNASKSRTGDVAAAAALGGAVMVFGAGLAQGCPSGHGISGMATFSIASFVSVAAMFGGGIAVANVVKYLL